MRRSRHFHDLVIRFLKHTVYSQIYTHVYVFLNVKCFKELKHYEILENDLKAGFLSKQNGPFDEIRTTTLCIDIDHPVHIAWYMYTRLSIIHFKFISMQITYFHVYL